MALRNYQQEMHERLRQMWTCHRSVMVQMPTGTGKTHVLAEAVKEELCRDEKACVWVVAHRRELVEQVHLRLDNLRFTISDLKGRVRVVSIQWLAKNGYDAGGSPTLIVIDEAHHALAETYQELWKRYPEAKFLGMTATPCRLNNRGFGDMFDVLLQSWSVREFIDRGVLSEYEYVKVDAVDGGKELFLARLQKRGADGDFQVKEMEQVMNRTENIQRLYVSLVRHAGGWNASAKKGVIKKGIVYAISIAHARAIAEFYSKKGIASVAIDSKTPASERKENIEAFKAGRIRVLVNVDVFSEGFDCPDVVFVQLARPTLSLAKYLQQVGRGLRKAEGKERCVLIDNVGLHRFFGMPDRDWNWQALFEGRLAGKAMLPDGSKAPRYMGDDLLQGWDSKGEAYYEDLRTGRRYAGKPKVMRYGDGEDMVELLQLDGMYYSRTKEEYVNRSQVKNLTPVWHGWYLTLPDMSTPQGYLFIMDLNYDPYASACVIAGDGEEVYWLCGSLVDYSIVVMDGKRDYYHIRKGITKRYIGSTRTAREEKELKEAISELKTQAKQHYEAQRLKKRQQEEVVREERLKKMADAQPFRIGLKWGLKSGERIVVVPKYRMVLPPVGRYCAFEENPCQWGVMAIDGRVEVDARYQKVDIGTDNTVTLTVYPGKVKTIKIKS